MAYITNVFPSPALIDGCTRISWYLSDDTMFFVAGVPLVALYHRHPHAGIAVALLTVVSSCTYTLLWYGFREDVRFSILQGSTETFMEAYAAPWARCPVYVIGLLCGFVWHAHFRRLDSRAKQSGVHSLEGVEASTAAGRGFFLEGPVRTNIIIATAVASAALLALPVYGSYWAYQDTVETRVPAWADHMYLAFSRPSWAVGVALMCALCFRGHGGIVNWFLTRPAWTTPSRLTYCAYLIHPLLLTWLYGARAYAIQFTALEYSVTYMGVAMGTFAAATAVHLVVEAPFRNLESLARRGRGTKAGL